MNKRKYDESQTTRIVSEYNFIFNIDTPRK
jgi:hypothetical protein